VQAEQHTVGLEEELTQEGRGVRGGEGEGGL
jgi:hypothetical protein